MSKEDTNFKDVELSAGGSVGSEEGRISKVVWSGVNKHFRKDDKEYTPTNSSEIRLVEKLNAIPQGKTFDARHSHSLDFVLKDDARYFLPDGTTNPRALLEKGSTTVLLSKYEETNKEKVSINASGKETEWGLEAGFSCYDETGDQSNPIKHSHTRSVELRSDSAVYKNLSGDKVVDLMATHDVMDDRAARSERILKFNELTPSMVNIDGAINTDDILLPDDVLVVSFRATSIEGIPASYYGREFNKFNLRASQGQDGIIVFSIIKNSKSNLMRFHITLSSAKLDFYAREEFFDTMVGSASSCCYMPTDSAIGYSTMAMEYCQSQEFSSRDLAIPVPEKGFKNCVAYRKSSAKAKVAAGGSAASLAAGGVQGALALVETCLDSMGCAAWYNKYPICCGITMKDSLKCYANCVRIYIDMWKACVLCKPPCVNEFRLWYPCGSKRCHHDMYVACCCIENATVRSVRSVKYEAEEKFELGSKASTVVKKVMYDAPGAPSDYESKDPEWKTCPCWTTLCCLFEYRGDCECRCWPKQTESSASTEKVNWSFEEYDDDDLFLEFQYRDAGNEIDRLRSNSKRAVSGDFIKLKLATNHDNVAAVHKSARKLVSLLSVAHSDYAVQFDEAKQSDDLRKTAAIQKASNAGSPAAFIAESQAAGGGSILGGMSPGAMLGAVNTLSAIASSQ